MNFSTLIYKAVTGEWRIDRQRVREWQKTEARRSVERNYAGAEPGTKRKGAAPLSTPEDFKQAYQRIILMRAARQLEEDFPFCDGMLGDFETYVVGDLSYRAATGNDEADLVINDYLDWQFATCDYSRRFDLPKLARLAIRSQKRDGELGWILVDEGDRIMINAISGDRIGNPNVGTPADPKDFGGIIVDQDSGAPVTYKIFRRLPKMNAYEFQFDVSANNFLHYFDPFRIEQYHGVTVFKNSIEHAFDLSEILDATKLNIKYRSSQLPTVSNEQGRPRGNGYESGGTTSNGTALPMSIDIDGVTQNFVKVGEGIVEFPNDFPNQQFQPMTESLFRQMAMGCKLPLEFVYASQAGGVVQRFYASKAMRTFEEDKRWLKFSLLNPTKNRFIEAGIKSGMLDLKRFGTLAKDPARFRGTWQMGREISVDYGREVDADIKLVDGGYIAPDDYISDLGGDPRVVRSKIKQKAIEVFADANDVAKKTGVPIEQVLPFISKKFANPASTPAPAPGSGSVDTPPEGDAPSKPRSPARSGGLDG